MNAFHRGASAFNPEANWFNGKDIPEILRPRRRSIFGTVVAIIAIALASGFGSAFFAIDSGVQFGALNLGLWQAYPESGTPAADPYSAAVYARTGRIPLAGGEGVAFTADRDAAGNPLVPSCDYLISGNTAPSRLWTLVALDQDFRLVATLAGRTVLTSQHLLRRPDGSFAITASPFARAGNWLPTAPLAKGLILVLRLYDTPLSTGTGVADVDMPTIVRGRCR